MGASYVDARIREFLSLTQGNKTVAEYEAEFLLQDELQVLIASQRERDFAALVEKAKIAEDVKHFECQNREKDRGRYKRDSEPSSSFGRPKKKAMFDGPVRAGVPIARPQPCVDCGRHPLCECWKKIGPARGGQQLSRGRGQAKGGNGVGRGHGVPGKGAGFTHSYIACTMSGILGIMCESTGNEMTVLSPLGQSGRVDKLFRDASLKVKHRASWYCATKRIVLKTTEDEEVAMIGELRDFLSYVIFTLWAKKLVRKGCEAILAYIGVSNSEGHSVGDIRTVKNFSNVFPDELPGLPPSREVEFGIELLPGAAPVSIAPYRMALNELVELKAQI
ncbi:uncharacterized protein [Gossypium hirsutum]|uniref:Uncharacterized protein n=1 Tax=Gossypium hirsutum TaxID=3635 RepID=A0A1U8KCT2_GOSHI|nr:uncharacterized protein LOC107915675 [Gossypium hirsutum]